MIAPRPASSPGLNNSAKGLRAVQVCLLLGLALTAGCGPPQVGQANYKLVAGLHTAISAQRLDWLETTAKIVAERHAAGELNDEQFATLETIIAQARGGDWSQAESAVVRLAKAQRPTAEEIEQLKAKPSNKARP